MSIGIKNCETNTRKSVCAQKLKQIFDAVNRKVEFEEPLEEQKDSENLAMSEAKFKTKCPCLSKSRFRYSRKRNSEADFNEDPLIPLQRLQLKKLDFFDETLKKEIYVAPSQCKSETDKFRRKIFNLDKINCHYHRAKELGEFIEQAAATSEAYVKWLGSVIEEAKQLRNKHLQYLRGESDEILTGEMWAEFSRKVLERESLHSNLLQHLCHKSIAYENDATRSLCNVDERDRSFECKDDNKLEPASDGEKPPMICFNLCKTRWM